MQRYTCAKLQAGIALKNKPVRVLLHLQVKQPSFIYRPMTFSL